jgi:diacylglycerol kinase (ATP)
MADIYHIIYNPYANRGGSKRYLDAFCALLDGKNTAYVVYETTGPGHATQITRDIIAQGEGQGIGTKYIVIMGGDGTIHEVVNGYCQGDDVVFGIVPAGTGNDVASMLQIPEGLENIETAVRNILEKNIKPVDFIAAEQVSKPAQALTPAMQSVLFFSYGIAAAMILEMQKYKRKNKFSYYRALLKNVVCFEPGEYDVTADGGETRRYKVDFCAVHNCVHAGGGMQLITDAVMDDGFLELFIVENRGFIRRIHNFIAILRKKIHLQPNAQIIKVKNVTITPISNNLCCVDGENHYIDQLKLSVRHKGIKVFG